ncbi:SpoIIE family protein phosphatase [Streptomyces sp. NBC_00053]|uniref:ATP-binding SpoIIE family protein phosphatase n=1 Tax=unclassified Streptomyces TaxID=2593676 RepID=UPI000F5C0A0E|nr:MULTISPECIES: SpoIIE family protein phosphatase [unclassified Streptomyces]MCX4395168.1 SpoIIE family protein phosphatase [Streptomyces sp. NBC_01767]MCX5161718.1 SpoIIE family protein phosphatase [Streptomyces sp. NBC_00305]MCX5220241.1 SpoIIE family protein phosphatase [Streptomyces sp. NBC_00264]MCX5502001.1 SpoIIE family protein phosphatase [Streptomyces sp. NBC_00052]MCX5549463.1 SpoIIE family protein phosphatase [Streptomyces sp. NBC_00051]
MNFTRWSARLPGTQRRAAARDDRSSVPSARAEYAQPETGPRPPGGDPGDDPRGGTDHDPLDDSRGAVPRPDGPALEDLSAQDILGQLPALVALVYGPDHRIAYVNDAYAAAFGPRPAGATAAEAMPELDELSLLPLMDQVLRSGTPRTVKSRKVRSGNSYTVTCTPVHRDSDDENEADDGNPPNKNNKSTKGGRGSRSSRGRGDESGVLVYAADVTDHAEAAERLRASERRHRETAVTLQRSLLPQELEQPDDLRIAATYQPGGTDAAVGGDWYDVITLGAGRTALVIGDVMGRGVRAAAVMGQLRTAVRAYARLDLPPHEVLQLLDGLAAEIDASQIATCAYAVHDPNEGLLVYASAGHLPILVCHEDGTVHRAEDPTGPPLGTGGWIHTSGTIALPPGSTAVLYTDGLVERRSEDIDEGVAALERALSGAKGSPQVVCDRLIRSLGVTAEHDDDVAVLVVQHPARTGASAELFHNASLDLLGGIEAAPRARAFATGVLTSWRFPVELCDLGVLAAGELVANSLKHGTPPMRLGLRRTDRRLIIEVTDGDDHLPRRRRADPADEAGRGISIVATIASSWGSRRTPGGGKAVWCEFALPH